MAVISVFDYLDQTKRCSHIHVRHNLDAFDKAIDTRADSYIYQGYGEHLWSFLNGNCCTFHHAEVESGFPHSLRLAFGRSMARNPRGCTSCLERLGCLLRHQLLEPAGICLRAFEKEICDPTSRNESRGYFLWFRDFCIIVHSIDLSLHWFKHDKNRSTGFEIMTM